MCYNPVEYTNKCVFQDKDGNRPVWADDPDARYYVKRNYLSY